MLKDQNLLLLLNQLNFVCKGKQAKHLTHMGIQYILHFKALSFELVSESLVK